MYNIVVYEWDEAKRERNLAKHGLDFADAWLVYENPSKITLPTTFPTEERWQDLAWIEMSGKVLALVYAMRAGTVRVVSFRPASRKERNIYEADQV